MIKLCKDCKYFVPDELYPQCSEPSLQQQSLVTGKMERINCSAARIFGCGPEGYFFKSRTEYPESELELPGMWEMADFTGGQTDIYRKD